MPICAIGGKANGMQSKVRLPPKDEFVMGFNTQFLSYVKGFVYTPISLPVP